MRVLFVDDEPRVLESIQRMLIDGDWTIATATSGAEALRILSSAPFDAIVSDMHMPGMDGAQLLAEVHTRWPAMTRIVLSGQSDKGADADRFLAKPCSAAAIASAVAQAFEVGRARRGPNARVRQLAAAVQRLPGLPRAHEKILEMVDDPDATVDAAADLLTTDPPLSAKVLRVANASLFGGGTTVVEARAAIERIGLDLLRAVLLLERAGSGLAFTRLERLHVEALEIAAVAACIAPAGTERFAVVAALLCDVGALVLEQGLPDEIAAVRGYAADEGVTVEAAEKELLGSSHADVGAYVLSQWKVSPAIVDAVAAHHDLPESASPLSAVVWMAHRLVAGQPVPMAVADRAGVSQSFTDVEVDPRGGDDDIDGKWDTARDARRSGRVGFVRTVVPPTWA